MARDKSMCLLHHMHAGPLAWRKRAGMKRHREPLSFLFVSCQRARQGFPLSSLIAGLDRAISQTLLESGSPVFSPYQAKDVQILEKVQHYFTRRIFGRCHKIKRADMPSAAERNKRLSLSSLAIRRQNRDLSLLHKLVYGHSRLSDTVPHHYSLRKSLLRGPGLVFTVPLAKHDYRKNSFFLRSARLFNNQFRHSQSHTEMLYSLSQLV